MVVGPEWARSAQYVVRKVAMTKMRVRTHRFRLGYPSAFASSRDTHAPPSQAVVRGFPPTSPIKHATGGGVPGIHGWGRVRCAPSSLRGEDGMLRIAVQLPVRSLLQRFCRHRLSFRQVSLVVYAETKRSTFVTRRVACGAPPAGGWCKGREQRGWTGVHSIRKCIILGEARQRRFASALLGLIRLHL